MVDKKVQQRVKEHYYAVAEEIPEGKIFATILCGSQNYQLDTEFSDVDTKTIIVPSFEDLIFKQPVNYVKYFEDGGQTTIQDIRLYAANLRKQNINYVETLFSDYFFYNAFYRDQWNTLRLNAEKIARMNPHRTFNTSFGMAFNYAKTLYSCGTKFPTSKEYKAAANFQRLCDFITAYFYDFKYKECLIPEQPEYLKCLKQGKFYSFDFMPTFDEKVKKLREFQEKVTNKYPVDLEDEAGLLILNEIVYNSINKLHKGE